MEENSKSVENHITKEFCGDHFCSTKKKNEEAATHKSNETNHDSLSFSSCDKTCFEELKDSSAEILVDMSAKSIKSNLEASYGTTSSTVDNSRDAESINEKVSNLFSENIL